MHPFAEASISNPDGSNEAEAKAMLQGTLHVSICMTSEDACSSTVVEIKQSIVQGYQDQQ